MPEHPGQDNTIGDLIRVLSGSDNEQAAKEGAAGRCSRYISVVYMYKGHNPPLRKLFLAQTKGNCDQPKSAAGGKNMIHRMIPKIT